MAAYSGHSPRHPTKAGKQFLYECRPFLTPELQPLYDRQSVDVVVQGACQPLWFSFFDGWKEEEREIHHFCRQQEAEDHSLVTRNDITDQTKAMEKMQLAQVGLGLKDLKFGKT